MGQQSRLLRQSFLLFKILVCKVPCLAARPDESVRTGVTQAEHPTGQEGHKNQVQGTAFTGTCALYDVPCSIF